ncbi:sensor histidine kinase [Aurantimonas sp. VKM B-3413]|uniref:sensor histidine kinase n=1 Tax=Aurantimonas sp. VKM B-3413 TaxID=2779401 RepID=UPI001E5C4AD4|nr:PAS domain-containing protein [Aurantimonas sp. VKM B-3413]MCB8837058.1 PAS domain-containing protein [Aurantimonas sp. VKM B-3413]
MTTKRTASASGWTFPGGPSAQGLRSHDWAGTALGDIGGWAPNLRTAVDICLGSPFPCLIWWGTSLVQIPNAAACALRADLAERLGTPAATVWAAAWQSLGPKVADLCALECEADGDIFELGFGEDDEETRAISFWATVIRDQSGNVAGLFLAATPRGPVEGRAADPEPSSGEPPGSETRETRRRLKTLVESIPQLVWSGDSNGNWNWASPQWEAFTGLSAQASLGRGWLEAVHPEDRAVAEAVFAKASSSRSFDVDYRLREASGRYRWFQTRATPSFDEAGTIVEWFGTSTDVDDLKRLQEHERWLLGELQHRVRNSLAVIRSIARRTADTSETAEDYAMHFEGRLDSFARVQAAATHNPGTDLSLLDLVADELVAATAREGENVSIKGPPVRLALDQAEIFGLAVHELTTNAIKFGALSEPGGHIAVRWQIESDDEKTMQFSWKETGVTMDPEAPRRHGFGMEMLQRTLRYQLSASASIAFEPGGLSCRITMPLRG